MPTLIEFINDVLQKENIPGNVEEIAKQIVDIARKRATGNITVSDKEIEVQKVVAISDEEVREMVINNAELSMKLAEEERIKKEKEEKEAEERRLRRQEEARAKKEEQEAEKLQKKLEKERKAGDGEQLTLGLFGENL